MIAQDLLQSLASSVVRFGSFAAHALLFGLVPILLLVVRPSFSDLAGERWEKGRRRVSERFEGLVQAALVTSVIVTLLGLVLQFALVADLRGGDLGVEQLEAVASTPFARWYLLRFPVLVALAILVVGKVRTSALGAEGGSVWWTGWALLAFVLLATSTFTGHAVVAQPRLVALGNDLLHLAAAATWFSGIVVLAIALPDAVVGQEPVTRLEVIAPAVLRFSYVAVVSIALVALTGVVNSLLHVGELSDLVRTSYGRVLATKVALFFVILALGGVNHFLLRERMREALEERVASRAQPLFRKTISIELAVAIGLMALTGILTGLARTRESPPPPTRQIEAGGLEMRDAQDRPAEDAEGERQPQGERDDLQIARRL